MDEENSDIEMDHSHEPRNLRHHMKMFKKLFSVYSLKPESEPDSDSDSDSDSDPGFCIIVDLVSDEKNSFKNEFKILKSTFSNLNFVVKSFHQDNKESNESNSNLFSKKICLELINLTTNEKQFSCIAIFIFGFEHIRTLNGYIGFDEVIDCITQNQALAAKPKLFFLNLIDSEKHLKLFSQPTSEVVDPKKEFDFVDQSIKRCREIYVLCVDCADIEIEDSKITDKKPLETQNKNTKKCSWLIYEYCKLFQTFRTINFQKKIPQLIETIRTKSENALQENPVWFNTLSKMLYFKTYEKLLYAKERGRCVILNNSSEFDTFQIQPAYMDLNFVCKSYSGEYLDFFNTLTILERESKNSINNCKCLVILIYASYLDDKGFVIENGIRMGFNSIEQLFINASNSSEEIRKCPKYIFINSWSKNNHNDFYFCKQIGNIFFSFNPNPVNFASHVINNYNYPSSTRLDYHTLVTNMSKNLVTNDDEVDANTIHCTQFNNMLIDHCTNTVPTKYSFDQDKFYSNNINYHSNELKGQFVVLNCDDKNKEHVNLISKTFKIDLQFNFLQGRKVSNFQNFLRFGNFKDVGCIVLFIFGHCTKDEIILEGNERVKIHELTDYFNYGNSAKYLTGRPKLIFIQNSSSEDLDFNVDLQKEFLLVVSSVKNGSFVNTFCKILLDYYVKYDLLSLLKLCSLLKKCNLSIKSTLSNFLFLRKPPTKEKFTEEISNKANLFYSKSNGKEKCLILSYESAVGQKTEILALNRTFASLNFETVRETVDNETFKKRIEKGFIKNFYDSDSLFMFVISDETTDIEIINELIENLAQTESLNGKPKILFLLGTVFKYLNLRESFANIFIRPSHLDFLVFQNDQISPAIESICKHFTAENTNLFDLQKLLILVTNENNMQNSQCCCTLRKSVSIQLEQTLDNPVNFLNTLLVTKENKGKLIIINNEHMHNRVLRKGTNLDYSVLSETFEQFSFDIETYNSFTKNEIMQKIHQSNFNGYSCLVVCLLTHGHLGDKYRFWDGEIDENDFIHLFATIDTLKGKPKIFITQGCVVKMNFLYDINNGIAKRVAKPFGVYPDLFLFCSTRQDSMLFNLGSDFVREICNVFQRNANDHDLHEIAAIVCRNLSHINGNFGLKGSSGKMTFSYNTLRKSIRFSKK